MNKKEFVIQPLISEILSKLCFGVRPENVTRETIILLGIVNLTCQKHNIITCLN